MLFRRPHALHRWPIFRLRITRLLALLVLLFLFLYLTSSSRNHHEITSVETSIATNELPSPQNASIHHGFLPYSSSKALCKAQNFAPYPYRSARRKVYDLFMLNDELDMLEIRLSTLYHHIDYFIIVESPYTFTGHPKPLILQFNWDRFEKYRDKIIHHVLENPPVGAPRAWDYEDAQRNAMFSQVFPKLVGDAEKEARKGDVIIVSDVDEIPRPATTMVLRECRTSRRMTLRSQFFYYSFQWRHVGPQWSHPQATTFGGLRKGDTILPADLRNGEGGNRLWWWWEKDEIWNAGWHCSTCFRTVEEVLRKMDSFSHVSLNQEVFREPVRIVDRVRKGMDIWDREVDKFERIDGNEDVPEFLKGDRERWKYILDRDGVNAGFEDFEVDYVPGD